MICYHHIILPLVKGKEETERVHQFIGFKEINFVLNLNKTGTLFYRDIFISDSC